MSMHRPAFFHYFLPQEYKLYSGVGELLVAGKMGQETFDQQMLHSDFDESVSTLANLEFDSRYSKWSFEL
jgi:hypothetical protein